MSSKYDNAPLLEDLAFKALGTNGNGPYAVGYTWSLPTQNDDGTWTPGEWTERINGKLQICQRGYHFFRWRMAYKWVRISYRLFVLEPKPRAAIKKGPLSHTPGFGHRNHIEPDKYATTSARLLCEIPWNTFSNELDHRARYGSLKYRGLATRREVVSRLRRAGVLVK